MNGERNTHDRTLALAAAAIDRRLDADERDALARHLTDCMACARGADSMRRHAAVLARPLAVVPPPRVDNAVHAAIAGRPARSTPWAAMLVAALLLAGLLGAALVGSALIREYLPQDEEPTLPAIVIDRSPTPSASPAATAEPSAEPSPAASAEPSRSPTQADAPTVAWNWEHSLAGVYVPPVAVGPDGTVYGVSQSSTCAVEVAAVDANGVQVAGWPQCVAGATSVERLAVDAVGNVYALGGYPHGLVGLAPDRTASVGWPREYGFLVGTLHAGIVVETPSTDGPSELRAYAADGSPLPGWPVTVPGTIVDPVRIGADDSVAVLYQDQASHHRSVAVFDVDGSLRAGWPAAVPAAMDNDSLTIDLVTSDGRIVTRSHDPWPARPTPDDMAVVHARVLVLGRDGATVSGWPVRFTEPLSRLVEAPGGRLVAVLGNAHYGSTASKPPSGPFAVVSIEADGSAAAGWPAALPKSAVPQAEDTGAGPVKPWAEPPVVGSDGSVVVTTGGGNGPEGVVWFEADGSVALSYRLPTSTEVSHGVPAAPSGPAVAALIVGDRAFIAVTVRAASQGARDGVLALNRTGPIEGWPLLAPQNGFVTDLAATPAATLIVTVAADDAVVVAAADPRGTGGAP